MQTINPRDFTFGIEEEFFLIERRTRYAPARVPKSFVENCQRRFGERVTFELQQAQVETVSPVMSDPGEALAEMRELRRGVGEIAAAMGMGIMAAGTHPLANWRRQAHTDKPRYVRLLEDFQIIGRRDVMCGLHVHVAVPQGDRVALMNRLMPWLPLFLALSTSSPFWNREPTGLLGYRQSAIDEWPRAGIPDFFGDEADYDAFVSRLAKAGALRDGSELWWAIRPSTRYPTLELRICDSCTRVEDTLALAILFRCLVSAHVRDPELGARRSTATRRLIEENRWRAQRYGIEATFIDEFADREVPVREVLAEALSLVEPDARDLDPTGALRGLEDILARGTSAHAQMEIYSSERTAGTRRIAALREVIDWLVTVTTSAEPVRGPAPLEDEAPVIFPAGRMLDATIDEIHPGAQTGPEPGNDLPTPVDARRRAGS